MQTGARYQAVLDLIEAVWNSDIPADNIINDYMRARKYIGSKDRRFIAETVWNIIRNRMKLSFDAGADEPRKIVLLYLKHYTSDNPEDIFGSGPYAPSALTDDEKKLLSAENEKPYPDYVEAECPQWLFAKIKDMVLLKSLNKPAPADFRINAKNREAVIDGLKKEGYTMVPTLYSPIGLRSEARISLGNCMAYQNGEIEVQDEASQLAAILCDVRPENKVIDYCCGAGGKSLAIAYLLNNQGHILAHDISSKRLDAIKPRMQRLGIRNIELTDIIADSDRDFDRFIIDAPCSGTGIYRRSPDAKFRLTPETVQKLNYAQKEILETAYPKVRSGGWIIYITCSVLRDENEDIIESFLKNKPDMEHVNVREVWERKIARLYPCHDEHYLRLSPATTGTDGFFLAILRKK